MPDKYGADRLFVRPAARPGQYRLPKSRDLLRDRSRMPAAIASAVWEVYGPMRFYHFLRNPEIPQFLPRSNKSRHPQESTRTNPALRLIRIAISPPVQLSASANVSPLSANNLPTTSSIVSPFSEKTAVPNASAIFPVNSSSVASASEAHVPQWAARCSSISLLLK